MASLQPRTQKDGTIVYRVQVRLTGHPPVTATFKRKTDARRWAQKVETDIREGRYFQTAEAKRHTFTELIDRYVRDVLPTKGTQRENQRHQLRWWKSQLGDYLLADVTPARLAECRDRLSAEHTRYGRARSPATVNRYLAALSHVFAVAVQEWEWLEDSPLRRVRKPREPRGRVRFLSDEERERLLQACKKSESPALYPAVVLALATGARKGEILKIRWGDVDFERERIVLEETKNRDRRALPLKGHALEVLRGLAKVRRIDTDLLFPTPAGDRSVDLRYHWRTAVTQAGITNFRFHDLRHSAASYLAMNGASLVEISEILGHRTLQMVKRYSHLAESHTAKVVERMNKGIFG